MATAREKPSPYYPPRARWYSPLLGTFDGVRRTLALDRLKVNLGPDVDLLQLVAGFFVPGLAFYFRLPGLIGKVALAWAASLLLMFFLFLGTAWDNMIFGLLLSVHVSGFVFYCTPLLGPALWSRLLFTIAMLVAIRLLVYSPVQTFLEDFVVTPLQWRGNTVIVGHIFFTEKIQRGDDIAYRILPEYISYADYEGGGMTRAGFGLGAVLGVAGDRITFSSDNYSVNGVPHPRLANMPPTGKVIVPEKEWFIWPNLDIEQHGYVGGARVPDALMRMALVTEDQLIGKPCKRWFWWRQQLS